MEQAQQLLVSAQPQLQQPLEQPQEQPLEQPLEQPPQEQSQQQELPQQQPALIPQETRLLDLQQQQPEQLQQQQLPQQHNDQYEAFKLFLSTAPVNWSPNESIRRFNLPDGSSVR